MSATTQVHNQTEQLQRDRPSIDGSKVLTCLCLAAAFALGSTIVFGLMDADHLRRLSFALLLNAWFVLTFGVGAIFFVALQHVTRAGWSIAVRRGAEILGASVVVPVLLLVPIAIELLGGGSELYLWNDVDVVQGDVLLQEKSAFLNAFFFCLRAALYAAVWIGAGFWLYRLSRKQDDTGNSDVTLHLERGSAPLLLAMAVTVTFAAFDWLMSLDPFWFSTIFGIYVFSGSMVAALAALSLFTAVCVQLRTLGRALHRDHLHDVTKLLFGFNCFWAYVAFSQYLLIWYANIPEETVWILHRQSHGWYAVTIALAVGHFVVPFLMLMPRAAKRHPGSVMVASILLIGMHWLDLYWLIYPQFSQSPVFGLLEVTAGLFCISATLVFAFWLARGSAMIPIRDPRLDESLIYVVHE